MRQPGADYSVVVVKQGNSCGAKGVGHLVSRSRPNRRAVQKMKEGPSESPCRGRLQTAASCCGRTAVVVNVVVKRRGIMTASCVDEKDECKRTADDAPKPLR
jgi:hypothetical protein